MPLQLSEFSLVDKKKFKVNKEYLPDEDVKQMSEFVNRQVKDHPVVKEHHGKWKELIAWRYGDQFSTYKPDMDGMNPVELVIRKNRVVVNRMKPLAETIDGKISFNYHLVGMPNSSETGDVESSKIATKLLDYNDYVNNVEELYADIKDDLINTGNAVEKNYWNRAWNGKIVKESKDEKGAVSKEAIEDEGEVARKHVSIFNVRPDPTAKSHRDMRWLVELEEVTYEALREGFGFTDEEIDAMVSGSDGKAEAEKYRGMNEPLKEKDKEEKTAIIKSYWEKATKKYAKGRLIIQLGTDPIFAGKNPGLGEIPFFFYKYIKCGNSFWGKGPLHFVQDLQRHLNRTISIESEHIDSWKAKVIAPDGSITKVGAFTTDVAEIVEYDETRGEPHPMQMPGLNPEIPGFIQLLMSSIDIVSNVHEVSYSQLPQYAQRAPASLYSMMLEQENLKLDPFLLRTNALLRQSASYRLRLMGEYYKNKRLTKILGKGQETSIEYWGGADLRGNYDVRLEYGISLNQSKPIQQRLLLELKKEGVITDNNRIIKALNLGDIETELRSDIADESRAERENQAFINDTYLNPREKGGVYIYEHDDPEVHLTWHTTLAKSEDAVRWPEKKWNALKAHIDEHFQMVIRLQAMAAQATQPGQPGVPGGGGATQAPGSELGGAGAGIGGTPPAEGMAPSA